MKFLIDMNLSPQWRDYLSEAGLTAEHWSRVGPADAADVEILDHASRGGWVIITKTSTSGYSSLCAAWTSPA